MLHCMSRMFGDTLYFNQPMATPQTKTLSFYKYKREKMARHTWGWGLHTNSVPNTDHWEQGRHKFKQNETIPNPPQESH